MTYDETRRRWVSRIIRPSFTTIYKVRQIKSYRDLAKAAGVSTGTIGNLLTKGKAHRPTVTPEVAARIAKALGVEHDDIFVLEVLNVESTRNAA